MKRYFLLIISLSLLAWLPTLNNWFFKGYEATWLESVSPHTFINLIRGHAFLYYLDLKIFGWYAWGWYLTSLVLHTIASLIFFNLIFLFTKKKKIALAAAMFFVANTAYNDVLVWGSFNSYYPLLLIFMLSSLTAFYKFKESGKQKFLAFSLIFSTLSFFTRETGIVVVPLLTVFDLIYLGRKRDDLIKLAKRQIPFYILLILFFVVRSLYGGTLGDSADALVKLQMKLVKDGLYIEYAKLAFLTAGKLIGPQIIPYPILNFMRDLINSLVHNIAIYTYFFSFLGWIFFSVLSLFIYKLRKTKYFKILFFLLIWLLAFSFFVALAVPNDKASLMTPYDWNTMRYRYFAFIGTSAILTLLFIIFYGNLKRIKTKRFLVGCFVGIILLNLLLIWKIERDVYQFAFKPDKDFITEFKREFPSLPKNPIFYLYPLTSGLNDYMIEFYYISNSHYPELSKYPYQVESQIIAVLDKIEKKKINLSQVLFLDYSPLRGLVNKTKEVDRIISEQKQFNVPLVNAGENVSEGNLTEGSHTEFPYDLHININLSEDNSFVGSKPDSERFRALVDYNVEKNIYLNTVMLKTAYTESQRAGEPFFHALPSHLIDGNIGPRSHWIADTFTPWVQVDLGKEEDVLGVAWGSETGPRSPSTYSFLTSEDGKNWKTAKSAKNFSNTETIDYFNNPVRARYVRMEIATTSGGDFVLLDEFEVLNSNEEKLSKFYKDRDELFRDANNMFRYVANQSDLNYMYWAGLKSYWGKMTWETNTTSSTLNHQQLLFPYRIDSPSQSLIIEIPEGEAFAGANEFLKKFITSLQLDFGKSPFAIQVSSSVLVPRYRF